MRRDFPLTHSAEKGEMDSLLLCFRQCLDGTLKTSLVSVATASSSGAVYGHQLRRGFRLDPEPLFGATISLLFTQLIDRAATGHRDHPAEGFALLLAVVVSAIPDLEKTSCIRSSTSCVLWTIRSITVRNRRSMTSA